MIRQHKDPQRTRQGWATPPWLVRGVEKMAGITFGVDLAAEEWSAKAPIWLGPGSTTLQDAYNVGLGYWLSWGWAWCNPPYNDIDRWVDRALAESLAPPWEGYPGLILLLPDRTDRRWWHALCRAGAPVSFLDERVEFLPPPGVRPSKPMSGVCLWQVGGGEPRLPLSVSVAQLRRLGRDEA